MLTARGVVAAAALTAVLAACATPPSGRAPSPSGTSSAATSKAADLRTHLDVLLAEHVMIVAKESVAAVNHADEYAAYAALLSANAADIATLFTRALGATSGDGVRDSWGIQNGLLVEYAIGAATHDAARSKAAAGAMSTTFVSQFAQMLSAETGLAADAASGLIGQQLAMDRAFIDDYATQRLPAFYADLGRAYAHASQLGDAVAARISAKYADKFPGDPSAGTVTARVTFNLLLQQDAYLATMASAAKIASRTSEGAAAKTAVAASAEALRSAFAQSAGQDAAIRFAGLWTARNDALGRYAARDRTAATTLLTTFADGIAPLAHTTTAVVATQANAMLKVLDDQLARTNDAMANDDRAAATAMEPIADAIVS